MSDTANKLRDAWEKIDPSQSGTLLIETSGPLDWYVGYRTSQNIEVAIVTQNPIDVIESSKSICVTCNVRKDKKYYISFLLTEKSEKDVFITMCSDIIDYSSAAEDEKKALRKVSTRYKKWRRLMAKKKTSILTDSERKGLIGELLFLNELFDSPKPRGEVLAGWVGPEGANQDFVYDEGWTEIKTTEQASDKIVIHSLDQLGDRSTHGTLRINRVEICAPELEGAFTLKQLVERTRSRLSNDLDMIDTFDVKLCDIGYIDLDVYDRYFYKFISYCDYDINDTFPRITRDILSYEIINCSYSISIPAINAWKKHV